MLGDQTNISFGPSQHKTNIASAIEGRNISSCPSEVSYR